MKRFLANISLTEKCGAEALPGRELLCGAVKGCAGGGKEGRKVGFV